MHLQVICIFPIAPSSAPKDSSAAQCRSVLLIPRVEVNVKLCEVRGCNSGGDGRFQSTIGD